MEIEEEGAVKVKTTSPRASRATESRGFEARVGEERAPIVFGGISRFNLPPALVSRLKDNDEVASWVVYSSGNTEQKENYYNAIDRHYKPIAGCDYPELARQYEMSPFASREEGDQLIRRGGQVLMKRALNVQEAEDDYYDSEKQRQEYMADMYKQADPRYPKPFMDERKRTRNRS